MNYLKNILQSLDSSYFGLVWATENDEIPVNDVFNTIDYLCDNLLTQIISKDKENLSKAQMLVSTHFDHPFWIFIAPKSNNEGQAELIKAMPLVKKIQSKGSNVALLQDEKKPNSPGLMKIKKIVESELKEAKVILINEN